MVENTIKYKNNNMPVCKYCSRYTVYSGLCQFVERFAIIRKLLQFLFTLRKHAFSNILKILPPKNEIFQIKNSDIFHVFAQNIDGGYSLEPPRRPGSNKYPQSMF